MTRRREITSPSPIVQTILLQLLLFLLFARLCFEMFVVRIAPAHELNVASPSRCSYRCIGWCDLPGCFRVISLSLHSSSFKSVFLLLLLLLLRLQFSSRKAKCNQLQHLLALKNTDRPNERLKEYPDQKSAINKEWSMIRISVDPLVSRRFAGNFWKPAKEDESTDSRIIPLTNIITCPSDVCAPLK